ncbi:MAG: YbbR-like domain-containing protein [Prevotella sp.]|nr:YbbR-like domain-containing protein [Prevotella sp.]
MGWLRATYQVVRNFLFSIVNKEFLIFLFFLSLSGVFWLMMTLNETYEQEINITTRIANIPKNVVLTSDSTDTVRVTVSDKGWVLITYLYGERLRSVKLNFRNYDRGNGAGLVSATEIRKLIEQQLDASSKIISIKPDKLEFFYNHGLRKRVPVHWTGRVIPEHLYFISRVAYSPDSVDVYASQEKLDSIRVVYTEPLNYVGFRDTLTVDCQLPKTRGVRYVPDRVKIGFFTDVLTEASIDGVPITCINMPAGKVLRTFPAKVKVNFVTGVSRYHSLRPEDFTIVVDYREIAQHPSEKCNIYLKSVPQGISRATLDVKQVDYLIEEE